MRSLLRPNVFAGAVLAASLGVTCILWQQAQQQVRQELLAEFDLHAYEIFEHLKQRMSTYEQALLGVRALFDSSEAVSREEFNSYISSLHLNQHYPGIQGISYTQIIPFSQKEQHITRIRQQGFPEYTIHPSGERDIYMVVVYIEPFTESNARVLGYDTYVEVTRQSAMDPPLPSLNLKSTTAMRSPNSQ
jgi:CHASE1-domain containing sensor protein